MEGRQKEYGNETTTDTEDAIKPGRVENEVSEGPVVVNLQINVDSHNNQNSVSIAEKGRKRIRKSGEVGQLKKKTGRVLQKDRTGRSAKIWIAGW